MKNIKLQNIFFKKIARYNNYLVNKFNQIKILKNKFNKINHLKNKFNEISNFNKLLILFISTLFLYLFYVSTPSLYDYQKLQSQLKTHLINEYNLNVNISDKIQYKILPSPHFEVKESTIYRGAESDETKLGEINNLKIFVSINNIHNQDKLQLKNIEIKESIFFLDKDNRQFMFNYFKNKNTDRKISIKKSKFFLMDIDEVISIFPIQNINFKYDKIKFINEVIINGKAFNSNFNLDINKYFFEDQSLNLILKFPQINLSVTNKLLPQKNNKDKYKIFNKINFFGSEIKSEFDIGKNSLTFKSIKSKVFNNQINFEGVAEFQPFFLTSKIILDQINLIKILNNNTMLFRFLDKKNLVHKNFNSEIIIDIKKFSNANIFNRGIFFIKIKNGLIKFNDTIFDATKWGSLKIFSSDLYNNNNKLFLNSKIVIDIHQQNFFYNTFQVPKIYRKDIKKINFDFVIDLTSGTAKVINFQLDNIISNNLTKKINKVIQNNNIDIIKNFNNWIVLKRLLNTVILQVNEE
jgi:hypothetical protein